MAFFKTKLLTLFSNLSQSVNIIKKHLASLKQDNLIQNNFNLTKLVFSNKQSNASLKRHASNYLTKNTNFNPILTENNVVIYYITNYYTINSLISNSFTLILSFIRSNSVILLDVFKRTFGDGFLYLRGLFILFFIDACLTDDEPI